MDTRLALTAEQRHKVESVNLAFAKQLEVVMKDSADSPAREAKLQALEKERDGNLKKVLTSGQFSRYVEVKPDMGDYVREQLREQEGRGN
jgi:copper homeostasis protein CutC